jgi:hypothetical protein
MDEMKMHVLMMMMNASGDLHEEVSGDFGALGTEFVG